VFLPAVPDRTRHARVSLEVFPPFFVVTLWVDGAFLCLSGQMDNSFARKVCLIDWSDQVLGTLRPRLHIRIRTASSPVLTSSQALFTAQSAMCDGFVMVR
jgi:hypothetical protein